MADIDGLVHDVLGACHTVLGHAATLLDQASTERERQAAAAVLGASRRLAAIGAAHRQPPRASSHMVRVDLGVAMADALAAVEPVLRTRRVEIDADLPPGVVVAAPGLRVVADLLFAWAAAGPRGGTLRVLVEERDGLARLELALLDDQGRPVPPRPTDRCLQLARSLTGTGAPAPTLDATTVAWTLPLSGIPEPVEVAPGLSTPEDAAADGDGPGAMRLLCVDDDEISRELILMALDAADGWEVVAVDSCASALEALASAPFDVVLVDNRLGDGWGIDLLRRIHCRAVGGGPQLVLTTGDPDRTLERDAAALGAMLLHKPIDTTHLGEALTALARSAPAGTRAAAAATTVGGSAPR